mmetsp:Transcript_4157/g.10741  ORF Transcript_4157/g.10741 Transcript_4157/m.10741 type:complete len:91 (-) Transcript_4157:1967-2239(-)
MSLNEENMHWLIQPVGFLPGHGSLVSSRAVDEMYMADSGHPIAQAPDISPSPRTHCLPVSKRIAGLLASRGWRCVMDSHSDREIVKHHLP